MVVRSGTFQVTTLGLLTFLGNQFWLFAKLTTIPSSTLRDDSPTHPNVGTEAFDSPRAEIRLAETQLLRAQQDNLNRQPQRTVRYKSNRDVELFLDRLNRLLPEKDHIVEKSSSVSNSGEKYFSLEDIAKLEEEILNFGIPRDVTVHFKDAQYISLPLYRWLFHDQTTSPLPRCPKCHVRFDPWTEPEDAPNRTRYYDQFARNAANAAAANENSATIIADVKIDLSCPEGLNSDFREAPWQVIIGGCGESQEGSGRIYATRGKTQFDYHAGFEKTGSGLFQTTYANQHLSPNNKLGFPELWSVTDFARQVLQSSPTSIKVLRREPEPAMFTHYNCGGKRGKILKHLTTMQQQQRDASRASPSWIARYGQCMKSKNEPGVIANYDQSPCYITEDVDLLHDDCEGTRDAAKTALSALHDFTFSLENTSSQDYVTEKRWQALLAGSVPIVLDNDNTVDSLPDTSSALIIPQVTRDGKSNQKYQQELREAESLIAMAMENHLLTASNSTKRDIEYLDRFMGWKEKGTLPATFVRKLFLSTDFLVCRICEHVAHKHGRHGFETKK